MFDESQIQEHTSHIEVQCIDMSQAIDPFVKYREIAIRTLKMAEQRKKLSRDVQRLFAKQLDQTQELPSIFYYIAERPDRPLAIEKICDLSTLSFVEGVIPNEHGTIPKLRFA